MNRRQWLQKTTTTASAASLPLLASGLRASESGADKPLSPLKITDIQTILTAPARIRLIVVKVTTSEPGLYGLGCATFTQRARVVETAVQQYLKPFLLGKDPAQIEDLWQSMFVSSYWRNGPVLGNAISGVDMALWDILGKRTGVPVYQLFGGKCRKAVDTYRHTTGANFQEVEKAVRSSMEKGWRVVRVQVAVPGFDTYGARGKPEDAKIPLNSRTQIWEPKPYCRTVPRLFEYLWLAPILCTRRCESRINRYRRVLGTT